jgi:hypothetical protein
MQVWTLNDGLQLVRGLQATAKEFGYHLTLGGSVLNRGESTKDIDLYFLPYEGSQRPPAQPDALIQWLTKMWGQPTPIGAEYDDQVPDAELEWAFYRVRPVKLEPAKKSCYRYKLKFIRPNDQDRIDVFIV